MTSSSFYTSTPTSGFGVFSPLQHCYGQAVDDFCRHQGEGIHKGTFWPLLKKAHSEAITSDNILAGFRTTGLIHFC